MRTNKSSIGYKKYNQFLSDIFFWLQKPLMKWTHSQVGVKHIVEEKKNWHHPKKKLSSLTLDKNNIEDDRAEYASQNAFNKDLPSKDYRKGSRIPL